MYVGEQRYVGHTELTLEQRVSSHRTAAKMRGRSSKLHVALRAANYKCTIARIEENMYETLNEARLNEDLWIKKYDTINNGLNSNRAITTRAETLKRKRDYDNDRKDMRKEKVACWNCDRIVRLCDMHRHRRSKSCIFLGLD
jgi:hypothetical protein